MRAGQSVSLWSASEREKKGRGKERWWDERERPFASSVCTSRLLSPSSITGLILREETSSCRTDVFTEKKRKKAHAVI